MNENYIGEKFLDKIFKDIYLSNEVQHTASKSDKKEVAIKKYMDRLERVHNKVRKADRIDLIKELYFNKYVIKEENLPYRLDEIKKQEIIDAQKKRLSMWIDYLSDENTIYPMWAKYWAFQGMLKLGSYDEVRGIYQRRSDKTISPFVEANPAIIANCINDMIGYEKSRLYPNQEVETILKTGSFKKLYEYYEKKFKSEHVYNSLSVKGEWKIYKMGSKNDATELYKSLKNKGTNWCTANEDVAINQVCGGGGYSGGDFYVYYTEDENGKCTIPRIAIRMNGNNFIGEIRGIEEGQCLETDMIPILESKLNSMTSVNKENVKTYLDKVNGQKKLFNMYRKTIQNEKLTEQEIISLYLDFFGFGWNQDPLVGKTIKLRNATQDINSISKYDAKSEIIMSLFRYNNVPEDLIIDDNKILLGVLSRTLRGSYVLSHASSELKDDKEAVLAAVTKDGFSLRDASDRLKSDKEVVLAAVKQNYSALLYANEDVIDDKKIMLTAISKNVSALMDFYPKFRDNKKIMLDAVKVNSDVYNHISLKLQNDRDIVLTTVERDGTMLKNVPPIYKDDEEIVLSAIKECTYAFQYASPRIRDNKSIVLEAVKLYGGLIEYASERLKDDKEVVITAITANCEAYLDASERLKNDRDVVLTLMKSNGYQFKNIPNKFKADKEIVLEAVKNFQSQLMYADKSLLRDREFMLKLAKMDVSFLDYANYLKTQPDFMLEAIKQSPLAFMFANEKLQKDKLFVLSAVSITPTILYYTKFNSDRKFMLDAIKENSDAIRYADKKLIDSRLFIEQAVKIDGRVLEYVSEKFKKDKGIVLEAIKKYSLSIKYADKSIRNDKEIVFEAIKRNPETFKFAGSLIKNSKEIIIEAIKINPEVFRYINPELKKDKEFISRLIQECPNCASFIASENTIIDESIIISIINAYSMQIYNECKKDPDGFYNEIYQSGNSIGDIIDELLNDVFKNNQLKQNKNLVNTCKQILYETFNKINVELEENSKTSSSMNI